MDIIFIFNKINGLHRLFISFTAIKKQDGVMAENEIEQISDLKQQISELRALVRFQAEIIDALPCTLVVVDPQFHILKTNAAIKNDPDGNSVIGQDLFSALKSHQDPQLESDVKATFRDHKVRTLHLQVTGENRVFYISPVHENSGLDSVVIMSCPESGIDPDQANAFIRDKYISLGQFSGKVAHDINNPLSVILTRMDYLQTIDLENAIEEGDVDIKEEMSIINRQATRIYDILDKVGALQMQGKENPVDADYTDVVTRAVTIAEFQRPFKTVHAEKDLPGDMLTIKCNEIKLERAIKEIVTNAFEAAGENGHVKIRLYREEPWLKLSVWNDGQQIKPGEEEHVLEPFITTKMGIKGAGLGLTIANGAALAHNGRIEIDNSQQEGTTVTLMIKSLE